jgi:hypothetical protein
MKIEIENEILPKWNQIPLFYMEMAQFFQSSSSEQTAKKKPSLLLLSLLLKQEKSLQVQLDDFVKCLGIHYEILELSEMLGMVAEYKNYGLDEGEEVCPDDQTQ